MRALTYHGPYKVSVDNMPDPVLQASDDITPESDGNGNMWF